MYRIPWYHGTIINIYLSVRQNRESHGITPPDFTECSKIHPGIEHSPLKFLRQSFFPLSVVYFTRKGVFSLSALERTIFQMLSLSRTNFFSEVSSRSTRDFFGFGSGSGDIFEACTIGRSSSRCLLGILADTFFS